MCTLSASVVPRAQAVWRNAEGVVSAGPCRGRRWAVHEAPPQLSLIGRGDESAG